MGARNGCMSTAEFESAPEAVKKEVIQPIKITFEDPSYAQNRKFEDFTNIIEQSSSSSSSLDELLENNLKFALSKTKENKDYFKEMSKGQNSKKSLIALTKRVKRLKRKP